MPAQIYAIDDAGYWLPPSESLVGHRSEIWRLDLLNQQDVVVTTLLGVSGGEFTFNVNATIRGGGSIDYQGEPLDWNKFRVQPWYRAETRGAEPVEWPLGVFLVATPSTEYSDTGRSVTLELYDKMQILDDDKLAKSFQVAKGANIIDAVRSVL